MKSGLVTSAVLHATVLTWGLWSLSSPKPLDASYAEALPIEIVLSETFEGVKGEKEAPISEKPAPTPTKKPETLPMPAENVGDNETDLATPPTPDKTRNQTPETAVPKPAAQPEPVPEPAKPEPKLAEATPPPPKPEPVAEPEPQPSPAPEPEPAPKPEPVAAKPPEPVTAAIDPLAEAIAEAEATPAPEPEPEPAVKPQPRNIPVPQAKPRPPAPVKVAEAKPAEPAPKAEKPAKPAKPAKAAEPREDASDAEADFEAMAAAVINKQKAAGGGAKRSTQEASLGSKQTTGAKLSRGEKDALIQQLQGCWNIPSGAADGENLRASVRFNLDAAGKLDGRPVVDKSSGSRVFDESAVRAIQKCDREGFDVPLDKAEDWAEVVVNFDPSEMF